MITLTTQRLELRPFTERDIDEFFCIIQDDEVKRYLPGIYSTDKVEVKEKINTYMNADFVNDIYFAIVDKDTKELLGCLIAVRIISSNMEISYFISKKRRREGLMLEALKEFSNWFGRSKINSNVIFSITACNSNSLKLCERIRYDNIPILPLGESADTQFYILRGGWLRYMRKN